MSALNSIVGLISAVFGAFLSEVRFAGRCLLGIALGYIGLAIMHPLRTFIIVLAVAVALASIV